uniref:Polysaccharide biosynthesis domain-containing protein n=1 Tax=Kalanchoe fedtschenkoi TaxID=63787 RepID=A0A7N0TAI9_KALFE
MKNGNNHNNNGSTRFILLHPYIQKQGSSNRLWWLLSFFSAFFMVAFLLTLIYTRQYSIPSSNTVSTAVSGIISSQSAVSKSVIDALLHYASNSNVTNHMTLPELKSVSDVLRRCSTPCNLLIFGLTPESLLWKALNHNGRTVFVDENRYYAAYFEEKHPEIEVYDVQYTTKISNLNELISTTKEQISNECRPVQNLLFSECKLGLNDLPNHVYEVDWDVIIVDGPRGYWPEGPGRMSSIFTSGVLARSKKGGSAKTHVFVHDMVREAERVSSEEFLCKENLVETTRWLGHFVVEKMERSSLRFCRGAGVSSSPSSSS